MKTITNVPAEAIELFESEGYTNYVLGKYEIQRRLDAHGTKLMFIGSGDNDSVFAIDEDGEYTINTKGWTLFDLYHFLGY